MLEKRSIWSILEFMHHTTRSTDKRGHDAYKFPSYKEAHKQCQNHESHQICLEGHNRKKHEIAICRSEIWHGKKANNSKKYTRKMNVRSREKIWVEERDHEDNEPAYGLK